MKARLNAMVDWLDERAGVRGLWKVLADEPVKGGSRWAYVFGSGLLVTFLIQAVTGVLLATYYSPSSTDAWASVYYIQHEVTFGWLIRGLHHYGASAMIVVTIAHATQTFLFGAYKKPRELNWIIGVLMGLLILGFGLTGYLLPWDQKGYWATRVASGIAGGIPVAGPTLERVMLGGSDYGNLTLTRFYALHVLVLPALLIGLMVAHLFLFRRHGATPPPWSGNKTLAFVEKFWPHQMAKDVWFSLAVVAVIAALTFWSRGAHLDAPADPASNYLARPEWYYLFLFQLLKYFEGPLQLLGTVVIPGVATTLCIGLPFLDRSPSRQPLQGALWRVAAAIATPAVIFVALHLAGIGGPGDRNIGLILGFVVAPLLVIFAVLAVVARKKSETDLEPQAGNRTPWTLVIFAGLAGVVTLFGIAVVEDRINPVVAEAEAVAAETAHRAIALAANGVPPGGGPALWESDPLFRGERIFAEHCGGCHRLGGFTGQKGPELLGYARREWLIAVLQNPHDMRLFGPTKMRVMAEYNKPGEAEAYAEFLLSESGAADLDPVLVERGRKRFMEAGDCTDCHLYGGEGRKLGTPGPELKEYGTTAWVEAFVKDPGAKRFFGPMNEMPAFGEKLSDREISDVVAYIFAERGDAMGPPWSPPAAP